MKRSVALVLSVMMLLTAFTACGKKIEPSATAAATQTPEATETPAVVINPLTGESVSEDISSVRPYAVMINNISVAQPQVGVSNADIMYEVLAEGGITRMLSPWLPVEMIQMRFLGSCLIWVISTSVPSGISI